MFDYFNQEITQKVWVSHLFFIVLILLMLIIFYLLIKNKQLHKKLLKKEKLIRKIDKERRLNGKKLGNLQNNVKACKTRRISGAPTPSVNPDEPFIRDYCNGE